MLKIFLEKPIYKDKCDMASEKFNGIFEFMLL